MVSNHPSSPVVRVVFYHVLEVSCYHSFWAVKLQLFLCLVTLGYITCKYLQVFRYSAQDVKFVCIDFKSASQSCLRIHLDCLTVPLRAIYLVFKTASRDAEEVIQVSSLLEEEVPTELKVLLTLTGTLTSFRSTPL